jgi:hypothetical protein
MTRVIENTSLSRDCHETTADIVADAAVLDAAAYTVAAEIPDHIAGKVVDEHGWAVDEPVQTRS